MINNAGLMDLHLMLMEEMQRLSEAESSEEIKQEQDRAKAMANIARTIIDNSKTILESERLNYCGDANTENTIFDSRKAIGTK